MAGFSEVSRLNHSSSSAPARSQSRPEAKEQEVKRFNEALEDKKERTSNKASPGSEQSSASELSSIFSALLSGKSGQQDTNSGLAQSALSNNTLSEAQEQLTSGIVERILVSDSRLSKGSEVRLLLGAGVAPLDGTEIILRRNLEGMLAVEFNSRNLKQFQKLVELRPALVEALEEHESQGVTLIFNDPSSTDTDADERIFNTHYYS